MAKQNKKTSEKRPLFDRRGKSGTYTVVMALILLAVLIVVNLIAGMLPKTVTLLDMTGTGQYEISNTSENFLATVAEDVTIHYIYTSGYEDSTMAAFLERYAAISGKLRINRVDPVNNPSFLERYNAVDLNENSVIVESGKRYKVIDYYDFFMFYSADLGQSLSYAQYEQYGPTYEAYYGLTFTPIQYYDSILTTAIEYVCAETVPSIYLLDGHNEAAFGNTVSQYFGQVGINCEKVNISLEENIPEDCTCLIINAPKIDLTESEAAKLEKYLADGGNVFLITSSGADKLTNLGSVTAKWGLSAEAGVVSEGTASAHYSGVATYIYPSVNKEHNATTVFASMGYPLLLSETHGITFSEVNGITTTALFTTTDKAFSTVDGTKGEEGTRTLCAIAEKSEGAGKLVWLASGGMISDGFINYTSGGNFYAFYIIATWMQGSFTSNLSEIPGVELSEATVNVTESSANLWGMILIFVAPGLTIGGGLIYWISRRRR